MSVHAPATWRVPYGRVALAVWAGLLGAAWCACSASDSTTRAQDRDDWVSSAYRPTPSLDAGPGTRVDTPALVDATPQPDAFYREPGWYCTRVKSHVKAEEYLSSCSKTRSACESVRNTAWEMGTHSEECVYQPTAYCFEMDNTMERYQALSCTETLDQCTHERTRTRERENLASTAYTECAAYE